MKKLSLLLLPIALLSGCTGDSDSAATGPTAPSEDTAQATLEFIQTGIKDGRPEVLWHAMPESYQNDVNGLVQQFAESMDADVWGQSIGLLQSVHSILTEKSEFITGNQFVASNPEMKSSIPMIADLLGSLIDGAGDLEKLKSFDGGTFMSTSGKDMMKHFEKLSALNPSANNVSLDSFYGATIETVESTDTTATLKITKEDGETETQNFVKHEGKWLPLDMVQEWEDNMKKARESLAGMPEGIQQSKGMVLGVTGMASGALSPLKSAETQEQFDAAVMSLVGQMGQFAPMMGGGLPGMGGGMEPPPEMPGEEEAGSLGNVPAGAGN